MRPSERTHHNVKRLHAVFATATLALLAATIWMLLADHRREWKDYQRGYRARVESPDRPLAIEQINLPELTVDYHFCRVARADRRPTCHPGLAAGGRPGGASPPCSQGSSGPLSLGGRKTGTPLRRGGPS